MLSMEDVYREHSHMVYQYLLSLSHDADLAEELTQETFYQAIRRIDYFNAESKVSTWLCGIAKNLFYAYLRKHPPTEILDENSTLCKSAESEVISVCMAICLMQRLAKSWENLKTGHV